MPIKVKIAERCRTRGISTAYKLQKALNLSPTVANRLFKGDFARIDVLTLDRLCRFLECQPADLLEFEHRVISLDKYRDASGRLAKFQTFADELSDDDLLSLDDALDCIGSPTNAKSRKANKRIKNWKDAHFRVVIIERQNYIPVKDIRADRERAGKARIAYLGESLATMYD